VAWIALWSSLAVTLLDMAVVLWPALKNSDMLQWYLEYGRDNCWSMVLAVLPWLWSMREWMHKTRLALVFIRDYTAMSHTLFCPKPILIKTTQHKSLSRKDFEICIQNAAPRYVTRYT
jgi:hypothetical protein